jgi:hypothetical protein
MKKQALMRAVLVALATALSAAVSAAPLAACDSQSSMSGMRERIDTLHEQMNRIEWTVDREEKRALMDLHAKHMQESMRELRKRDLAAACRMDIMSSMLEEMARHQQALGEQGAR